MNSGFNITLQMILYSYDGEFNICNLTQNPPNIPTCNYEKESDELNVTSMDIEGDRVKYGVSWNNDGNVDQWTELHDSDAEVRINCEGRKGVVGVIAEDEFGAQSEWTSVKVKNKTFNTLFLTFLHNHPNMFPIPRQLLQRLGL